MNCLPVVKQQKRSRAAEDSTSAAATRLLELLIFFLGTMCYAGLEWSSVHTYIFCWAEETHL
jgi:hypothetical protein